MRAILTITRSDRRGAVRTVATCVAALSLVAAAACSASGAGLPNDDDPDRLQVVASFYPLVEAGRRVGGACVDVVDLTPAGVEPHDLELTTDGLEAIATADLVVYLGGGFQPAVEEGIREAAGPVVAAIPEDRIDGDLIDPHIWLDPSRFSQLVGRLATELRAAGAADTCRIEDNATAYRDELDVLNAEFATGLSDCRDEILVSSHAAFGYLAQAYGLRQEAITGLEPESEPDARRMAELRALIVRQGVSTIFTEELAAPDVAETLASEVGARIAVLKTIETEPADGDYLSAMRDNLQTLRGALGCS